MRSSTHQSEIESMHGWYYDAFYPDWKRSGVSSTVP